jgi:hypothetical protein
MVRVTDSATSHGLWAYHNHVQIDFSRPGKLTGNADVESFNGTFARGVFWMCAGSRR